MIMQVERIWKHTLSQIEICEDVIDQKIELWEAVFGAGDERKNERRRGL